MAASRATAPDQIVEVKEKEAAEKLRNEAQTKANIIGREVLTRIGRPDGFLKLSSHHLWANKYRVNVWSDTSTGPRIVHSEFVVA